MSPRHNLSFCACKTTWFAPEWQVYMGSSPHLCFFNMQNSNYRSRLTSLYGSQTSSVVLSTHNSVLSTRIKRLYGFQPSRVFLCMQISDFSSWITGLYWSQPSSVVFAFKTATLGLELQASVGARNDLSFCTCTTACLASESLVSMGPSPHLWFLIAKWRVLYPNNESLWVPDPSCHFVHAKQRD